MRSTGEKLAALEEELDAIPNVREFKQSQTEVNELLQLVSATISNKITNEIIASTGGDLLSGKTGAALQDNNKHHKK